jgi:N-acetylglucosamine-6-phosphate deacetylase
MQIFNGAMVLSRAGSMADHSLIVDNGRIAAVVPYRQRPAVGQQIDLDGGVLAPGLIDLQVNGGGGVLFNDQPTHEAIDAIARAHRRDGTTGLLPTVITDTSVVLNAALEAACEASRRVPGVFGIHVEGPFIDPRRPGVHRQEFMRLMQVQDADGLIEKKTAAMLVTLAPSAAPLAAISRLAAAGVIVSLGHSEASDLEALAAIDAGARSVTHLFNAMSPLHHRSPGLTGAALADRRVTCGLIADGIHVSATAVRVALAAKSLDTIALVSDAMPPAAGGPPEFSLQGRPVHRVGNHLELADHTLAGAAITLMDAVRWLVRQLNIPLASALHMASFTPACLIGISDRYGCLAEGYAASFIHLDDELRVRQTWIDGIPVGELSD